MMFLTALLIALPAFAGNIAPVIGARLGLLRFLARPIDRGVKWRAIPILGANKTWRGVVLGIIFGTTAGAVQFAVYGAIPELPTLFSSLVSAITFGAYGGALAILGDILESFIKRRIKRESGSPFLPWDQTDYMIAFLVGTYPLFWWSLDTMVFLLLVAFLGNLMTNYVSFKLGIKPTHW